MQQSTNGMLQDSYDAIVIGAGHNGLTNGAFLAKAGLDVLVLEKNEQAGGRGGVSWARPRVRGGSVFC